MADLDSRFGLSSASDHPPLPAGLRVEEGPPDRRGPHRRPRRVHPHQVRLGVEPVGALVPRPRRHRTPCRTGADLCLPDRTRRRWTLVGSIDLAFSAIAYQRCRRGLTDPILTAGVRQVRRGLRRITGTAPRRQARPLDTDDIRQIVEHIECSTALGVRDAALTLLGFTSAMRRSELVWRTGNSQDKL